MSTLSERNQYTWDPEKAESSAESYFASVVGKKGTIEGKFARNVSKYYSRFRKNRPRKTKKKSQQRKSPKQWTKQMCLEEAKKYSSRSEWRENSSQSYLKAGSNGWRDECCAHMTRKVKWTKEKLMQDAKRYETRKQWQVSNQTAYYSAWRRGILDECCQHMSKKRVQWTDEMLFEDALRFKNRTRWARGSHGAYQEAKRRGILDMCVFGSSKLVSQADQAPQAAAVRAEGEVIPFPSVDPTPPPAAPEPTALPLAARAREIEKRDLVQSNRFSQLKKRLLRAGVLIDSDRKSGSNQAPAHQGAELLAEAV